MEEVTTQTLERDAANGALYFYQLAYLDDSLLNSTIRKAVYKTELPVRIDHVIGGFETNSISGSLSTFQTIIDMYKDAQQHGIEFDFSPVYDCLRDIYLESKGNVHKSEQFLLMVKESPFETSELEERVEDDIHFYAPLAAREILKSTRRAAKNSRKVCKTKKPVVENVLQSLKKVSGLSRYGVNEERRIEEIRNLTYDRSVSFPLRLALEESANSERALSLEKIAESNKHCFDPENDL